MSEASVKVMKCQRCKGNGRIEALEHCPACNGAGFDWRHELRCLIEEQKQKALGEVDYDKAATLRELSRQVGRVIAQHADPQPAQGAEPGRGREPDVMLAIEGEPAARPSIKGSAFYHGYVARTRDKYRVLANPASDAELRCWLAGWDAANANVVWFIERASPAAAGASEEQLREQLAMSSQRYDDLEGVSNLQVDTINQLRADNARLTAELAAARQAIEHEAHDWAEFDDLLDAAGAPVGDKIGRPATIERLEWLKARAERAEKQLLNAVLWAMQNSGDGPPEDHHLVFDLTRNLDCSRDEAEQLVDEIKELHPHAVVSTYAPPAPTTPAAKGE